MNTTTPDTLAATAMHSWLSREGQTVPALARATGWTQQQVVDALVHLRGIGRAVSTEAEVNGRRMTVWVIGGEA